MKRALMKLALLIWRMLSDAWLWVILFAVGGAVGVSFGVAIQFGFGYGLISGGAIAMCYGISILKGLRNAE